MELTHSNITSPSKQKSKFSQNQVTTSLLSDGLCQQRTVYKKYSEDLTKYFEKNSRKNERLNELKRKKFATLTPLLTPRDIITQTPNLLPQSANIPFIPNTNFKKLCKLGAGCQAFRCFKCIDIRDDKIVVVKEIKNNDEEILLQFQHEYKFIKTLEHQNIVKAIEFINENETSSLVMEYAEGKQLLDYLEKLTESEILNISYQLFSALAYLHSKKIMHRDLHLKNIIYDKNKSEIKIIDFGIAKQLRERAFGASCAGAVDYRAPEMLNYQPYAYKIDCWQCGLILLQLVNHKKATTSGIMKKIENQQKIFKREVQSKKLEILITSLLEINPDSRFSAQDALEFLLKV